MSWERVPFESLYAIPSKNGLTRPARVRGSGYKMINMGELFAHDRIGAIEMEIVPMNEKELETMLVDEGDLMFARQSLVLSGAGKCSIVKTALEETTFESHIIRVRLKKDIAYPNFFFYYFKSPQCGIKSIVTQGVQAGIRGSDLKTLSVALPKIDEQIKIADILVQYDDLIENNRRRIQLLEESARLLYQEWFVQLRFPGHEQIEIADGVPQGWSETDLGKLFSIRHGYAFKGEYFSDEETNNILLTPGNFKVGGGLKLDKKKFYKEDGPIPEDYVLSENDLLITMTDLSKMSDTLGYPMLVPKFDGTKFLHNQRLGLVVPTIENFPKYFVYHLLQDYRYRAFVVGSATGTSVKHTAPKKITSFKFVIPDVSSNLVTVFNEYNENIYKQISTLTVQNHKLARTRDLLLPKLMSGELTV
jgi:type I restriction enzyme S subunit